MKFEKNRKLCFVLFGLVIIIGCLLSYSGYFLMGDYISFLWHPRLSNSEHDNFTKNVIFKYSFKKCDHIFFTDLSNPPDEFEKFNWINLSEDLSDLPEGWELLSEDSTNIILKYEGIICPICMERQFLGTHNGQLAVFYGNPPDGKLKEILPFEAKDAYKEELIKGIPFENGNELKDLLENYTS